MKKIIQVTFLLLTILFHAQTVTYTENVSVIANPERGLQKYSISTSGLLNQTTLTNWRNSPDRVTVVYRYFILPFGTIPVTTLNNMQTDFNSVRGAGLKIIVRFSYTNSCDANCVSGNTPQQPNKAQILAHINQLTPIVNSSKDVIFSIQVGFIGTWGEFYYTGSSEFGHANTTGLTNTQWNNRKDVVDAMLSNFDSSIPLQLRYVGAKTRMYGTAFSTNGSDRLGFYNDAFLNNYGDQGTYTYFNGSGWSSLGEFVNPVGTVGHTYLANETQFLPMTGETNGLNAPRTNGANALLELDLANFTTLNRDYYTPNWNNWIASGNYNEIVNRLGYRFILDTSTFSVSGNSLSVTLNMRNTGFARMFKAREVFLVLRDGVTTVSLPFTTDIRNWEGTFTLNQTFTVPDGNYEAFLYIPDSELSSPSYAVQLANNGLWEATTGFNRLNQNFEITSTCVGTSTWNGANWTGGLPSETRNVIINGNYNTEINGSFDACNLTVNGSLTVSIGTFVTFQEHLEVVGNVLVLNGGTLIPAQTTSTSNGNVSIQRRTTVMKRYDYTYFGSPVATTIGQALGTWQQNYTFEFVTPNFVDEHTIYANGTPTVFNSPDGQDDAPPFAWIVVPQTEVMQQGKGYASMIRSVPATGSYPRTELVTFTGDLTTGVVNYPLQLSGNPLALSDDYNLVSNPYSASINANDFITLNLSNISGTLAYWTHQGNLSPTYSGLAMNNFSTQDYAYYNLSGGTASAFGTRIPTNIVGSCQGFIVEANNTNNLTFLPNMMSKAYSNTTDVTFFRTTERIKRAWISLHTEDKELYSQQLVAYHPLTTKLYEAGWDSQIRATKYAMKFYSLDEKENKNNIQARGDFYDVDEVRLGYISAVEGKLTISLDSLEGIEKAYIKDYGVVKELPYTFETQAGEFKDRFKLVYRWSVKKHDVILVPNPTQHTLTVYFDNKQEGVVGVFDLQGQQLTVKQTVFLDKVIINTENLKNATYLIRVGGESYKFVKD